MNFVPFVSFLMLFPMCLKGILFDRKRLKNSIKFNLRKLRNKEILARKDKDCNDQMINEIKCDHKYDLNCENRSCDLHDPSSYNAYRNFCEIFFTKPLEISDFFYKDCRTKEIQKFDGVQTQP